MRPGSMTCGARRAQARRRETLLCRCAAGGGERGGPLTAMMREWPAMCDRSVCCAHLEQELAAVADEVGSGKQQVAVRCAEEDGACARRACEDRRGSKYSRPFITGATSGFEFHHDIVIHGFTLHRVFAT